MNTATAETGFRLEGIHFPIQRYGLVDEATLGADTIEDPLRIGWDWAWVEQDRSFDVAVSLERRPEKKRPEQIMVQVVGRFTLTGHPTSVQIDEFALNNATAILFPYARQVLFQLSANGPFGAQVVQPVNIANVVARFDPRTATAARQREDVK